MESPQRSEDLQRIARRWPGRAFEVGFCFAGTPAKIKERFAQDVRPLCCRRNQLN